MYMMKSPNKDLPVETDKSEPAKEDLWNLAEHDSDTNEPSSLSSFSVNESILHDVDEDPENPLDTVGNETTLNEKGEKAQNSTSKKQTARKSLWRGTLSNLDSSADLNAVIKSEPQLDDDVANISAKVLHFFCQKCNNGIRYSPNDLQKHFLIMHNGESPLYPCEMCNFSANDFQTFKQHRKTHRSALVKCELCNNDYLYTLLALTKHFTVMHCNNGHFNCSKCKFSTRDVGTFVQHIHRHNGIEYACQKCNHISFSKAEFQKHLQGHSALFPFSCQYCNYSAMRKDFIVKHVLARHREQIHTKDELLQESCDRQMETSAGLKLVFKRFQTDASDKGLWRKESNSGEMENDEDDGQGTSGLQYNSIDKSQTTSALSAYNMDQTMQDRISSVTTVKCNNEEVNSNVLKNAVHGPTVLMVKNNKINVPANYSATFMGYKMVNGKQNIVIKLLPSNKQSGAALQSPSPTLGSSTPQAHGLRPFGVYSNGDRRPTPSFKPNLSSCPTSVASLQKMNVPFRPRTESYPIRHGTPNLFGQGTAASQAFLQSLRKDLVCRSSIPNSSIGTGRVSNIKEEPEEYSINEQHNMQKEWNHGHDFAAGSVRQGRMPNPSNLNPSMQHLPRYRHSSDSGLALSKTLYTKDSEIRNSLLHSLTASRHGGLNFTNTNIKPQNDYLGGNLHMRDKPATLLEKNSKSDNILFMPRITSVFSLQNRAPASAPHVKNTYLHNMLQENKTLYDRLCTSKNTLAGSSTPTSIRLPNVPSRFEPRLSGDNVLKGSASSFTQGQRSSALHIRTSHPSRVGDLLRVHSDAIVNRQLAKEKMLGIAQPAGSSPAFRVVKTPQNTGYPHSNTVFSPSNSNATLLPILPTSESGLKMTASQPVTQSNTGINTNTPVNAKSNMVLTLTNGPFGTIRNVSNGNPHTMASPVATTGNYQGKLPLPRLQRPAAPYLKNAELKDIGTTGNNLHAKILSGSTPANKLPINLLQYHINSNSSVGNTGNLQSVKNQKSVQKQPVYALLPDGKQAVLLNYVLPKSTSIKPPKTFARFLPRNIQPKTTEEAKETSFVGSNSRDNSLVKVKIEDTSAENPSFPDNTYAVSSTSHQGITEHSQWSLRSRPNFASMKDHLYSTSSQQMILQPCATNKLKCKPSIANTWNTRNKSLKRKASDSSSCAGDFDLKNKVVKKKSVDEFVGVPRKKMLHRKCKEKVYYTSDVIDIPTPSPPKDIVQTLRLYPFNASQVVTCPQQNQPVVVLNHPHADMPEVVNVMRTISKFSSHVLTVTLSKRTLEALLESKLNSTAGTISDGLTGKRSRRAKPISPANDRFVLKLTLKKTSKNNYKIVKNTSENQNKAKFHCWFCGRIFDNQDEWVGHGQRHLMEATKDWNTLF